MLKKKTLAEINRQLPDLKSEKVEVIADELDRILAIKRIFTSEDGKELLAKLKSNCVTALRKASIAAKKGDNANPFILDWQANMDLLGTIQDISMEKELREQLDEAVKEAYRE